MKSTRVSQFCTSSDDDSESISYQSFSKNGYNYKNILSLTQIYTEGKSLAIYFEDSQFRRNRTFNFILSNIYVDKRSRIR